MKRRYFSLSMLAAIAAPSTLSACGFASGSDKSNKSNDTVTWMSWESAQANTAMDTSFQAFTESTGITMRREESPNADYSQKLASMIMSKTVPDFFWCSNVEEQTLAAQGLLFDWTEYAEKNDGLDMSQFSPGSLDSWYRDGKLYGVPTLANTYGFFYNKSLLDAAGVAVPANGWSYDEMFEAAAALTGKNGASQGIVTQWSLLTSPFGLAQYAVSAGGQPLTDTVTGATSVSADPKLYEAAERYAQAISAGQITATDYDASNSTSAFANGSIPLLFGGQWLAQTMVSEDLAFEWGFVTMPIVDQDVQPTEANGVCSPATLENPDQVWKAISYLESTGFNDTMRTVPVAPIAYLPGSEGYFEALEGQGTAATTLSIAVQAELNAPTKVQTGFLDGWSTKAGNILLAEWNPAINGTSDTAAGIDAAFEEINELISSS